jgi:hypothetical protein
MARFAAWFLADNDLVLCHRGHDQLVKRTKRGIPQGAISFESEEAAARELGFLDRQGFFFLWTPAAKAVRLTWS